MSLLALALVALMRPSRRVQLVHVAK
jgi:hypothetical protein